MARTKKGRISDDDSSGAIAIGASPRKMEATGIGLLVLASGLCFALVSFEPHDRAGRENLVGPVGHSIASLLLGGVGAVGYLAALLAFVGAGAVLLGRARWPRGLAIGSALGVTLAATVIAHLLFRGGELFGQPAGGAIGAIIAEPLRASIGSAGAALFAIGVLLVSLLGVADVSFGAAIKDTGRFIRWGGMKIWGAVAIWREAREAELDHEEELLAAYEEKRLEKERARLEKEQKLREQLEEKKRAAIMKAQSKAEERVLAKIAADEARARAEAEAAERARIEAEEAKARAEREAEEARLRQEAEEDDTDQVEAREPNESEEDEDAAPEEEPEQKGVAPWQVEEEADDRDAGDTYIRPSAKPAPLAALGPEIIPQRRDDPPPLLLDGAEPDRLVEKPAKKSYQLPPLKLLDYEAPPPLEIDREDLRGRATRLEEKLRTYKVEGRVTAIRPGPVVTTYEYQPAPGVKVSTIASLADDIKMSMAAHSVRIIAPIPGKSVVGIELPNEKRESVYLKELIAHERFGKSKSLLSLALGKDTEGETQVRDLAKMPHLLVAGTTGSGKSVSVNAMILSILYKATPDQVKFIMVDPKMLELSLYDDIPHLLLPVVTDAKKASLALQWAVDEMERRYKLLSDFKVRNIEGFNKKIVQLKEARASSTPPLEAIEARAPEGAELEPIQPESLLADDAAGEAEQAEVESHGLKQRDDPWAGKELPDELPYIVVLIDEFADLMCVAPRDVESSVQRLAQKARAAGIHVMLATQRPSTDVITGVIKNNFPCRISFRVASRHDSATIINQPGAENLLGMGDMLALSNNSPDPLRIHGAFVSEEEVQRVVQFWKEQGKPVYDQAILRPRESEDGEDEDLSAEKDEMYDRAVQIVVETKKASISALQRRLRVGYNRAARMIELMEKEGIVSAAMGPKGDREVLVRAMAADGPPRV
jgi:DNA segregation ATPase FtsK/SpoIIIE, S-DNA-T family